MSRRNRRPASLAPSDAYAASRPLFIEHRDEDKYRYTKVGSAVLIRYRGHYYAVAARHSLYAGPYGVEQIRIPARNGPAKHATFVGFDDCWIAAGEEDAHDFLLLRLTTRDGFPPWRADCASLTQRTTDLAQKHFTQHSSFAVSGYPNHGTNLIDYEANAIWHQRCIVACEYDRPTDPWIHSLNMLHEGALTDYRGLSGGLVMARTTDGLALAGMVITGSPESKIVRFIDIRAIVAGIRDFEKQL